MKTRDFWYELPKERIAQTPLERRDDSRLLVIPKEVKQGRREDALFSVCQHRQFSELPDLLTPGDCLVLNNSRVLPARLIGTRAHGGAAELLLLREHTKDCWEVLAKPAKRIRPGDCLVFGDPEQPERGLLRAEVLEALEDGLRVVRFLYEGIFLERLAQLGEMPLPPYITRRLNDPERYQTVYASENGSAAAPTAGLHFTPELLETLKTRGVEICELTLHVGLGTFRPVQAEDIEDHVMHSEVYVIPEDTARRVEAAGRENRRVIAVGTTACRALESAAEPDGALVRLSGSTELFITPGYRFRVIGGLITNFHLPGSTLLMLVSALAGRERMLAAYQEAVREEYRFFSLGDCCLIV